LDFWEYHVTLTPVSLVISPNPNLHIILHLTANFHAFGRPVTMFPLTNQTSGNNVARANTRYGWRLPWSGQAINGRKKNVLLMSLSSSTEHRMVYN
jgi:hypothetical protein